ncbi:hypothetical protein GDO78_006646 [Eleutherodactylus coqui]|uniref:Uncharacterized protein n=1 Tax=Eleutherodactylus coqui TaxID=57060 RepID=A0A8J6FE59_ELECQ|nr:hypothetical protein GDO78_006646 [Eleutherodactylus coqui]
MTRRLTILHFWSPLCSLVYMGTLLVGLYPAEGHQSPSESVSSPALLDWGREISVSLPLGIRNTTDPVFNCHYLDAAREMRAGRPPEVPAAPYSSD